MPANQLPARNLAANDPARAAARSDVVLAPKSDESQKGAAVVAALLLGHQTGHHRAAGCRWVGGEAPVPVFRSVVSSPPPAEPDLRLVAASGSP